MRKKHQHTFSSVVSINPYNDTYLSGASSFLTPINSPQFSKEQFIISYLNSKNFITNQISISKSISDEDLFDAINSKVYDEFALDQAIEYKMQFIETFNSVDSENRYFHVFIVDPLTLSTIYQNSIHILKYIDTIIPVPLLLKSLYSKEIIEGDGAHCFIYFQKNDAFVTIYNEQEFLYTRSIKYSFLEMHERFCELYGERIEYEVFIEYVSTSNLRDDNSDYKEYLLKLYKEIFANITDILTYTKRAFEIEKIDQLYIGAQISTVTKLDEIAETELGIRCSDFYFDYGFKSDIKYIDQLHALMYLYSSLESEDKYECNFTIFYRPPTFTQRESGKIIMLVGASLFIAFIYPLTYWSLTYAQSLQYIILQNNYKEIHRTKITREATIKSKEADKLKITTLLNQEKQEYLDKKNTLIKIHDIKVNYPMKAKLLTQLIKDLNKFDVKIDSLSYNEENKLKKFIFNLVSTNDKKVTKLLEYLTKVHENRFKFSLEQILFKEDSKLYFSELKVQIL
jgi:hypothetical protein